MSEKILHQSSWAFSAKNSPIEMYEYRGAQPILMIGGVHGDEPEGVRLAQDLLSWLQKSHKDNVEIKPWILIPCLNIDGFSINERTNGNHVDLNRNFPSSDWTAESKGKRYSPGPHPASEPEVRAVVKLIEKVKPSLIIHFHSWEPCVVYTGSPGKAAAEMLGKGTGYEVKEDIGYPTPGSLGQYGWLDHQTPVICIEAQLDSDLNTVWPKFGPGLMRLLCRN